MRALNLNVQRSLEAGDRLDERGEAAEEVGRANTHELDVKVKQRIRWDHRRRALRAIAKVRWDDELSLAANAHRGHALVPALHRA